MLKNIMTKNNTKYIVRGMMDSQKLRELLKVHLEQTKESQNALAKRLNIQQSSIFRFIKGDTNLAFEPAIKVLKDMGYELVALGKSTEDRLTQDDKTMATMHNSVLETLKKELEFRIAINEEQKKTNEAQKKVIELQNQLLEAQKKQQQENDKNTEQDTSATAIATNSKELQERAGIIV